MEQLPFSGLLRLVLATLILHIPPAILQDAREQQNETVKLAIRVSATKESVKSGEPLELEVELWNEGFEDVFVCKNFERLNFPLCSVSLYLESASGRFGPIQSGIAYDYAPSSSATKLSDAVERDWICLRPGHSYGAKITLSPELYPQLLKPGAYKVLAEYSSAGLLAAYAGTVVADSDGPSKLCGRSWSGKIESRPHNIRILSK